MTNPNPRITERQIEYLDFISRAGYARTVDAQVWMEDPVTKTGGMRNTQRALKALLETGYIRGIGLGRRDRAFCLTHLGANLLRTLGRGQAWTNCPAIPAQFEHHSLSLQSLAHLKWKLGASFATAITEHQRRATHITPQTPNFKIFDGILRTTDGRYLYVEQENSRKTGEAARRLSECMVGILDNDRTAASIICYTAIGCTKDDYDHERALLGHLTEAVIRGKSHLPPPSILIPKLLLARTTLEDRDSIGKITRFQLLQCWWDGFEVKIDGEITDWPSTLQCWPRKPFIATERFLRKESANTQRFDEKLSDCFEVIDLQSQRTAFCGYSTTKDSWLCQIASQAGGEPILIQQFPIGNAGSDLAYLFAGKALEDYRPVSALFG